MKSMAEVVATLSKTEQRARPTRTSQVNPRDEEDAAYRAAWGQDGKAPYGRPLRAAFYEFLPQAPRHTKPDPDGCRVYVMQITECMERGCWSRREMDRLRTLRKMWDRRARGEDARYIAHGNAPGRTNALDRKSARPGDGRSTFEAIQNAIRESGGLVKPAPPTQKFVVDAKWPFGRPNSDRRM